MANLVRVWEAEPLVCPSMKDVIEMVQTGVQEVDIKKWQNTGMAGRLLTGDESERKGGRPLGTEYGRKSTSSILGEEPGMCFIFSYLQKPGRRNDEPWRILK